MSVLDAGGTMGTATAEEAARAAAPSGSEPFALPPLRQDLRLLAGPADRQGAPTWTIFDSVRHRYFRVGHAGFEMLRRWRVGQSDRLVAAIAAETVLTPEESDVAALVRFLRANGLLARSDKEAVGEFSRIRQAGRPAWWKWMVHNYLFVRIPIVRPDRFLARTQPIADAIASPPVRMLILAFGLLGLVLAIRQWDQFLTTFMAFANWQGAVWAAVVLTTVKILHELGHAYTARRYGCRVPTMGVAFLVMYPVLYTDTSDSWRLTSRIKRLRIGAAGIRLELALALIATFAWSFIPEGPARSAVFLIATATWISTLLINLNPFLRFDGYYLMSDWLDIANLQPRAFALTRWWLRERLFGFGFDAPEPMAPGLRRTLIAYGFATWIYRFFLFLGIAVLVYHFFFKTLGILLFIVEIVWFIIMPVAREIRAWVDMRDTFRLNANIVITGAALALALWAFLTPLDSVIRVPAILQSERATPLLTALPGRIERVAVENGDRVAAGQVLFELGAPDLASSYAVAVHALNAATIRLVQAQADKRVAGEVNRLEQEVAGRRARLERLEARMARLSVRAPITGRVTDLSPDLHVGRWLGEREPLGVVVAGGTKVTGYVDQENLNRVNPGTEATFYPEDPARDPVRGAVSAVDNFAAAKLETGYMAAPLGGTIEARMDEEGRFVLLDAVYKVTVELPSAPLPGQVQRGRLHMRGPAESLASHLYRRAAALLVRESGF